jgi:hypothetical protein
MTKIKLILSGAALLACLSTFGQKITAKEASKHLNEK